MTRSAPYLRRKWLVVAWCLQSVAYLVTCAFPSISTMAQLVVERERKKQLTSGDRKALYFMAHSDISRNGHCRGVFKKISENFRIAPRQASRVYHSIRKRVVAYLDEMEATNTVLLPDELFKDGNGNRGAEKKWDRQQVADDIKRLPLAERSNLRVIQSKLGIPYTTVHRLKKVEKILRPCRGYIKPKLTESNAEWRLDYAWSQVGEEQFATGHESRRPLEFDKQYNKIHVDEKWFYLLKEGRRFYLAYDEERPYITQQSKQSIPKVMFLCALSRPRYVQETRSMFDGKIGIWPIGFEKPAARTSVNRPAGTLEFHSIKINRDVYRDMMSRLVLPAILSKWPTCVYTGPPITIQQDGATPHFVVKDGVCTDREWNNTLKEYGLEDKIFVITQPANSPDVNVNDLGFFNSLQSYYWRTTPKNPMELIAMVEKVYQEYPYKKLNKIWLSYLMNLNEIIKHHGGNKYKTPHMGKDKLEREGRLPVTLPVYMGEEEV